MFSFATKEQFTVAFERREATIRPRLRCLIRLFMVVGTSVYTTACWQSAIFYPAFCTRILKSTSSPPPRKSVPYVPISSTTERLYAPAAPLIT